MKKFVAMLLVCTMAVTMYCGCGKKKEDKDINKNLDTSEKITLNICGPWTDSKGIKDVGEEFSKKYPNCTVDYEYLQNFNDSTVNRLQNSPDTVDLFITSNIQVDSPFISYAMELFSQKDLDLSDTNDALIKNFTLMNSDKSAASEIYCIPLGGDLRGLYVNKTLLKSVGLDVPKNADEFMNACKVLKDAGYVPVNGNPGAFGQRLLYPYICNLIANSDDYQKTYDAVNNCQPGASEMFRKPMSFMYELMENYYYNYKFVETEYNMFTDTSYEGMARDFLNIKGSDGNYAKTDDVGTVAFMAGSYEQKGVLEKTKEDYHSKIDFEFIMAPVSEDGAFAYVSPAHGIAVNKNSSHADWAVEFLDFFFRKDNNKLYAEESNCIANTKDSFKDITARFDVPKNHISDLGQVTFDYPFYDVVDETLINISKGNNPKYMNTDENGNKVLYSFDYYMEQFDTALVAKRESRS